MTCLISVDGGLLWRGLRPERPLPKVPRKPRKMLRRSVTGTTFALRQCAHGEMQPDPNGEVEMCDLFVPSLRTSVFQIRGALSPRTITHRTTLSVICGRLDLSAPSQERPITAEWTVC
jgi:hypothetical protein